MLPFRLVAFDLDNTLVGADLQFSPRLRAAVARAQARGVVITLATGRGPVPTDRFAAALNITAPLVCSQGAIVYDYRARQALHEICLDPAVVPLAVQLAEARRWELAFEGLEQIYLSARYQYQPEFLELLRVSPIVWADFAHGLPDRLHKFLFPARDVAERTEKLAHLRAHFAEAPSRLTIIASHPLIVEGVPRGVDKAAGLAWLAAALQIPPEAVMAVGDHDNDVEMLTWAGWGVAMADGSPAALAAADAVTPPVSEDGAALALEKYVLAEA